MKSKAIKLILISPIFILIFSLLSYYGIALYSSPKCYTNIKDIPKRDIAILLGTSRLLNSGYKNQYFYFRTRACIKLFESGKVKHILISGDNGRTGYNEPEEMMNELIKGGVPREKITLDFAGFRTLDSVIRARKIFGVTSAVFVSQEFHNQRAIFLSRFKGIDALGFNAKDVSKNYGLRTQIREYFARSKAILDIFLFKNPKYLGKKEIIDFN